MLDDQRSDLRYSFTVCYMVCKLILSDNVIFLPNKILKLQIFIATVEDFFRCQKFF